MKPVTRTSLRSLLLLLALAFAVILAGILPINAGFVRGPVEDAVRDAIGMELSIGGPVKLRLGPWPEVSTGDLALGGAAHNPLLLVESVRARISLSALLSGQIHVLEVESRGITVDYCSPLPEFSHTATENAPPPSVAIDDIAVTQVSVRCGPSPGADPLELSFERVQASAPQDASMQVTAAGSFSGMAFDLTATGDELKNLLAAEGLFPITAALSANAAAVDLSGHLEMTSTGTSVEARVDVRATNVQALAKTVDIELPDLGSLAVRGNLRGDLETVDLVDFDGHLGTSRFVFNTALNIAGERPHAELAATLDPLDIAPFLGTDFESRQTGPNPNDGDIDFSSVLGSLETIDVDLHVDIREILGLPIEINNVELRGQLTDGVVALQSLGAQALGGQVAIDGSLDSRAECPELEVHARLSELELAGTNVGGRAGKVNLETSSCGRSLYSHRKSLHATAELIEARARLGGEPVPVSAKRLDLNITPGEHSRVRFSGVLADEAAEGTLTVGSLEALLGSDTWPITLDARGSGGHLRISGHASLLPELLIADAEVRFDAPAVGTLRNWTGIAAESGVPVNVATELRVDQTRIVANDIRVRMGKSDVGGRLVWQYTEDPYLMTIALHSNAVDLTQIASMFPPETEHIDATRTTEEITNTQRDFALPAVDLDLKVDELKADRLDIQDLSIGGRLRKGLVDNARVSLVLEDEMQLQGKLDLDARRLPARGTGEFSADNVDIGRVLRRLEVADDLQVRADGIDLRVTSEGTGPIQFISNLVLEAQLHGFDWRIPRELSGAARDDIDTFDVTLENVELAAAPNQSTTWSSAGAVGGVNVELWVETPSLNDIIADTAELPISLVAAANNDVTKIDVRIDRSADEGILAHLVLSGEVIASQGRTLSQLGSPLEDYQLQSNIILTGNHLQLPDVQVRMGTSAAEGRFDMDGTGPRTRFDVALHAPYLQTDDLLYWTRDFREGLLGDRAPLAAEQTTDNSEDANDGNAEDRSFILLARNFVTKLRENNDIDINITVDKLHAGSNLLGGGEIHLRVDENDFLLRPVSVRLPGGGMDAEYAASISDGRLDASLRVKADAMTYGGLLRLADNESKAAGIMYVDANISTNTQWSPDSAALDLLFDNADGSVSAAVWPEELSAGLLDLWSANLVLAILKGPGGDNSSRLNCVVSRFDIEDGLMKSKATLLDTTDSVIRGRGTIDLAAQEVDLVVWPQAKMEKFLSVSAPAAITGSFDDIEVGVVPAGFIGTLIKWYTSLIYVPFKWITGERFPEDGTSTCFDAMDWKLTPELNEYFLKRDFSSPPVVK